MHISDQSLLALLTDAKTQRKGFSMLVSQYSEPLYRQIRRIVYSHDDANDILQNTFIKAWQGLSSFEGRSSLSSWLHRIAINEALDFTRRKRTEYSLSDNDGEQNTIAARLMADEYFDGDETIAQLHEAIDKLPEVQKRVFQMRYFDEMKYSEISEILGTSEGALKASYHYAVAKISDFFNNRD